MTTVSFIDKQIVMHTEALVKLPVETVRELLLDFDNLPQVITDLKEVRMLEPGENGQARMQVTARICIAFFCLTPTWIQQIRLLANGDIEAIINLEESDFREGWGHWRLLPRQEHTLLVFDARLNPKIWFPPGIGPLLMQHMLEKKATKIAQGLERVAARRAPGTEQRLTCGSGKGRHTPPK